MTFKEILEESRARKYAFLLDGVQANILLLLLELAMREDLISFGSEFQNGSKEILGEVRSQVEKVMKDERFITLDALMQMSNPGSPRSAEVVKKIVEKLWNGRIQ